MREGAGSHGWNLSGVEVFELIPPENLLDENQQQSLLYSSDLELGETTKRIFEAIERAKPERVVLDSLSEIRLLAQSSLRYRRQILSLKHYFSSVDATVLLLDDLTTDLNDKTVHSVAHGVIRLEETAPEYGAERRRMRVIKYRGRRFRGGFHDFTIATGAFKSSRGLSRPSTKQPTLVMFSQLNLANLMLSWAAVWNVVRASWFSDQQVRVSRYWLSLSSKAQSTAASGQPCSSSMRNWASFSNARKDSISIYRQWSIAANS